MRGENELFELSVLPEAGDRVVLALRGECDLAAVDRLAAGLDACVDDGHRDVVLDLCDLEFLDCAALDVVLTATRRAVDGGGSVVVRSPQGIVQRLLELSGATEQLTVEEQQ